MAQKQNSTSMFHEASAGVTNYCVTLPFLQHSKKEEERACGCQ